MVFLPLKNKFTNLNIKIMKTNKVTIGTKSIVKIDKSLDKHAKMNLFKKKFDESTAALLKTDNLSKLFL